MKEYYRNILCQIYYIALLIALISSFFILLTAVMKNDINNIYPWEFTMLLAMFISVQYTK